jgi:hypothetical protein
VARQAPAGGHSRLENISFDFAWVPGRQKSVPDIRAGEITRIANFQPCIDLLIPSLSSEKPPADAQGIKTKNRRPRYTATAIEPIPTAYLPMISLNHLG